MADTTTNKKKLLEILRMPEEQIRGEYATGDIGEAAAASRELEAAQAAAKLKRDQNEEEMGGTVAGPPVKLPPRRFYDENEPAKPAPLVETHQPDAIGKETLMSLANNGGTVAGMENPADMAVLSRLSPERRAEWMRQRLEHRGGVGVPSEPITNLAGPPTSSTFPAEKKSSWSTLKAAVAPEPSAPEENSYFDKNGGFVASGKNARLLNVEDSDKPGTYTPAKTPGELDDLERKTEQWKKAHGGDVNDLVAQVNGEKVIQEPQVTKPATAARAGRQGIRTGNVDTTDGGMTKRLMGMVAPNELPGALAKYDDKPPAEQVAEAPSRRPIASESITVKRDAAGDSVVDDWEKEQAAAIKKRDQSLYWASVADGFHDAADIAGGTQTKGGGGNLRSQAENPLSDLKAKQAHRNEEAAKRKAAADDAYDRTISDENLSGTRAKNAAFAERRDPASRTSAKARATVVSLYPKLVAKIPPEEFKSMSAEDVDRLLGEAAPEKVVGTGTGRPGGLKQSEMNTIRKGMPAHLVDTYNAMNRVESIVNDAGGWEKTKTGIAGGMVPSLFMDDTTKELRQELGGVVARFLQAGGGKSITSNEERILIGAIKANPLDASLTPKMLQKGYEIIKRAMAADTRQSLAGVPRAAADQLLGDMGIDRQWVDQDLSSRTAAPNRPAVKKMRNPKTGEVIEVE